jgi:hypothetical protein
MKNYSLGRGRKKAVERFTIRQGLSMLAILSGGLISIFLLYMLGHLHIDAD